MKVWISCDREPKSINFFLHHPLLLVKKLFPPLTHVQKKVYPLVGLLPNNNGVHEASDMDHRLCGASFLELVDPTSWSQFFIAPIFVCPPHPSSMIKNAFPPSSELWKKCTRFKSEPICVAPWVESKVHVALRVEWTFWNIFLKHPLHGWSGKSCSNFETYILIEKFGWKFLEQLYSFKRL